MGLGQFSCPLFKAIQGEVCKPRQHRAHTLDSSQKWTGRVGTWDCSSGQAHSSSSRTPAQNHDYDYHRSRAKHSLRSFLIPINFLLWLLSPNELCIHMKSCATCPWHHNNNILNNILSCLHYWGAKPAPLTHWKQSTLPPNDMWFSSIKESETNTQLHETAPVGPS